MARREVCFLEIKNKESLAGKLASKIKNYDIIIAQALSKLWEYIDVLKNICIFS